MRYKAVLPLLIALLLVTACQPNHQNSTAVPPTETPPAAPTPTPTQDEPIPPGAEAQFSTDFSIRNISFAEVLSGGVPKDGIPAINDPVPVSIAEADQWLANVEPVIFVEIDGEARAYPLQILMWHEIVNDRLGDTPIAVTFCPLCNTAIVFEREVDAVVYDFGTTGRLRFSNLIMYDRQTETWWQQATGKAIVGTLTGTELPRLPGQIISWEDFKTRFPGGDVLSKETGYDRSYGDNPYPGYDDINQSPFLYSGPTTPDQLPPMARVIAIDTDTESLTIPYEILQERKVINAQVGGLDIVAFWSPGTASALDSSNIAEGQDVGAVQVFDAQLDGRTLTFVPGEQEGAYRDQKTNSLWNQFGKAVEGPLAGEQLDSVVAINFFWFSWVVFKPDTRIYQP